MPKDTKTMPDLPAQTVTIPLEEYKALRLKEECLSVALESIEILKQTVSAQKKHIQSQADLIEEHKETRNLAADEIKQTISPNDVGPRQWAERMIKLLCVSQVE